MNSKAMKVISTALLAYFVIMISTAIFGSMADDGVILDAWYPELPVKLSLDDTNDVFSRFSAYFEQQNRELINSTQNAIKLAIKGVNKPFFKNES